MTAKSPTCTLAAVLAELGSEAELLGNEAHLSTRAVAGSTIWSGIGTPRPEADLVIVCPPVQGTVSLAALFDALPASPPRIVALTASPAVPSAKLRKMAGEHAVVVLPRYEQTDVVLAIARATDSPDETVSRRLSALQRSLTLALSETEPVPALLAKLKSLCNATVALVDKRGRTIHASGPLPMSLLMTEIASTEAPSQSVQADGWYGLADRISDPTHAGEHFGWLIATARRSEFPDGYSSAAIHVATTLVEASLRMTQVTARQERAVRSAVLEEAIALDRRPRAPELAGRLAGFGLSFSDELRAVVCQPTERDRVDRANAAIGERVTLALGREGIPHLISGRDRYAILLVQCTPATFRRLLVAEGDSIPEMNVGIGRAIRQISDVADSFHDAQLAVRSLRRPPRGIKAMCYDDFTFATRLFSDVGLDSMLAWADAFLEPLDRAGSLFESLRVYFEQHQNINAAAELLHVHHNSLRYRLAKTEELLKVSLRDPAAVASVYLALAAVDLGSMQSTTRPRQLVQPTRPADIEAPGTPAELSGRPSDRNGVVFGLES